MKKFIALVLALCLAVSLFGCADSADDATTPTATAPEKESVTYKSYTVSDEKAFASRGEIVATVGNRTLTSGEFNVCYWMGVYSFLNNYGAYASYYGLDYTVPLDQHGPTSVEGSWQEFFIEDAMSAWHVYTAVALAGEALGVKMPEYLQTDLDGLRDVMLDSAEEGGFASVDAMIQAEAGAGCNGDDYYNYTLHYYEYLACLDYWTEITEITDEDIEAYFNENKDALAESKITKESGNVFDVRHILIKPEGGTTDDKGVTTYSDAEWEACREKAQSLMDEWAGGDATEDTFAEYAKEHSADGGSSSSGGLYEDLTDETSFVEPFKNWYLDESRQVGDYGLVKTEYGYHIMYMSNIEAEWIAHCRDAILTDTISNYIDEAKKQYPIESFDDKIVLGNVVLSSTK